MFEDTPQVNQYIDGLHQSIEQTDIIKVFDNLLTIAAEVGASDIHIEAFKDQSRIRLRIDGVLRELTNYPTKIHDNIIAKFKIES
jgi:general secretion pathway protein E